MSHFSTIEVSKQIFKYLKYTAKMCACLFLIADILYVPKIVRNLLLDYLVFNLCPSLTNMLPMLEDFKVFRTLKKINHTLSWF